MAIRRGIIRRTGQAFLAALLVAAIGGLAFADEALIVLDSSPSAAYPNAEGLGSPKGDPVKLSLPFRKRVNSFGSVAFQDEAGKLLGGIFENDSGSEIADFHLDLKTKGDKFSRSSSGGDLFKSVKYFDKDGNDVTGDATKDAVRIVFDKTTGKGIPDGTKFTMVVSQSNDYPKVVKQKDGSRKVVDVKGKFSYEGIATPKRFAADFKRKMAPDTAIVRNDANPTIHYDGTQLTFGPGNLSGTVNYVQYSDDTFTTVPTAFETAIGAAITITPMQKLSEPTSIPGATRFGDAILQIESNSEVYHLATLVDNILIPDPSNGYGAVLQSSLLMNMSITDLPSQYLEEFANAYFGTGPRQLDLNMLFRTDLLSTTNNLTLSGSSVLGQMDIALTVPEPATILLVAHGALLVGVVGYLRTKRCRPGG